MPPKIFLSQAAYDKAQKAKNNNASQGGKGAKGVKGVGGKGRLFYNKPSSSLAKVVKAMPETAGLREHPRLMQSHLRVKAQRLLPKTSRLHGHQSKTIRVCTRTLAG